MTAMTAAERRFVTTGFAYIAGSTDETDARDTWYTARDLMRPDHEHVWVSERRICDPQPWAVCSRCGQRTDFDQ